MKHTSSKYALCAAALFVGLSLAGCGETYSRDDFTSAVMGKSEDEVKAKFGKPALVDEGGQRTTWTYSHETFDLGNQNRMDSKSVVVFEGAAGERHATKTEFR